MQDALARDAAAYGIRLSEEQLARFARYYDLLVEWSTRARLVGNIDPDVVRQRHFVESLALGAALREREVLRPDSAVLDVGAGAGFPGIPIKIAWPSIRLALLEATTKKAAFLEAAVNALPLDDTTVITGRAEDLGHDPALRESFDLVLARAVAPLPVLLELTLPFARVGGRIATPKGSRASAEAASAATALRVLGAKAFTLPLAAGGPPQTIVLVVKQRPTPAAYPRRPGIPARQPL